MLDSLNALRLFAVILIVSSHLHYFFPDWKLSFGGGIGNSIFYFLSGYTLSLSQLKNKLALGDWFKRRFTKIIIPFLLFIGFTTIGSFEKFINQVQHLILIHSVEQLYTFFPVLWILYVLFPMLFKLKLRYLLVLLTIIITSALIGISLVTNKIDTIPNDIITYKIFFTFNGFACFVTGMICCRSFLNVNFISSKIDKTFFLCIVALFLSQYARSYIFKNLIVLVPILFPLNLFCVVLIYIIFCRVKLQFYPVVQTFIEKISKCSLAVFIIHFQVASMLIPMDINTAYKIILLYLYTFLLAYPLTVIGDHLSNSFFVKRKIQTKNSKCV